MKYLATFKGRKVGAIGITYYITASCEGDTKEAAILDLYKRYDHISQLTLTEVN